MKIAPDLIDSLDFKVDCSQYPRHETAHLMNLELLKAGYPPCVLTVENRLAYYEALDQWMAYGKTEAFIKLVVDAVLEGFKPYQIVLVI